MAILLLDRENDELYILYAAEEDPQIAARLSRVRMPAYRGVAGKVLRTAQSLRVDDTASDRWFFAGVDEKTRRTTRSLACAPLVGAHGALGVIEAVNPRSGGQCTDDDLALLDALAQTIAGAVDDATRRAADTAAPGESRGDTAAVSASGRATYHA